ncbi:MAG: hypothetical protein KC503_00465 [Myxococcales bacterium]|nr:hypothetical protein [Myxococcales bacterium]
MTTRTNRTSLFLATVATFGLLVVTSGPALAGGGFRGRVRSMGQSMGRGLSRARSNVSNRISNARSFVGEHGIKGTLKAAGNKIVQKGKDGLHWVAKNPGKAIAGGVILGLAVTNPVVGAAAAKAAPILAAGATAVATGVVATGKAIGAVMATKLTVGHAVAAGAGIYGASKYKARAKANGNTMWQQFKSDAKGGFGLKALWSGRKDKAPAANQQLELNFDQQQ